MNLQTIHYQYYGSIDYVSTLINATHVEFSSTEMHDKSFHLNRTWLYGPNNLVSLSIPLKGGRNCKQPVGLLEVAENRNWKRIHWRTIHDCYRKSPWFEEYSHSLRTLYESDHLYLVDWCRSAVAWVLDMLGPERAKMADSDFDSGLNRLLFASEPFIQIADNFPRYQQVFSDRRGFAANLSILDLLMNVGPLAPAYLHQYAAYKKTAMNPR